LKLCTECFREFPDEVELCPQDEVTLAAVEPDPLIGTRLQERYEIQSVLGRGGMGVVYKARHEQMDRTVAIKMLHSHMVSDADAMKRFHREAKAVSRVKHPNSITLYDFGVSGSGQPFIVMDYIEGTSLKRLIKQQGRLSLGQIEHIFAQVCAALSCAHEQGVIHRDLKPENIMLTSRAGDQEWVQVVDFGISKLKSHGDETGTDYNITRIGDVCGSPPYMSPEQCMSAKPIDQRSDIYALGVVLYESLSGRLPFKAKTAIEMIDCHLYAPPTPLKAANPDLALCDALQNILLKALQKEPERRQQSVEEFYRDLVEAIKRDSVKLKAAQYRTNLAAEAAAPAGDGQAKDREPPDTRVESGVVQAARREPPATVPGGIVQRLRAAVSRFLSGEAKQKKTAPGPVLDNCPYCASPLKPKIKFCLECGRNMPSLVDLTKLRQAQQVFSLPKAHRSEEPEPAPDFSTKAKIFTSRRGTIWGVPRPIVLINLIILIILCFFFMTPRRPSPQDSKAHEGPRHHAKRLSHHL